MVSWCRWGFLEQIVAGNLVCKMCIRECLWVGGLTSLEKEGSKIEWKTKLSCNAYSINDSFGNPIKILENSIQRCPTFLYHSPVTSTSTITGKEDTDTTGFPLPSPSFSLAQGHVTLRRTGQCVLVSLIFWFHVSMSIKCFYIPTPQFEE